MLAKAIIQALKIVLDGPIREQARSHKNDQQRDADHPGIYSLLQVIPAVTPIKNGAFSGRRFCFYRSAIKHEPT